MPVPTSHLTITAPAVPAESHPTMTSLSRGLIAMWNRPVRVEPLYGSAGSAVYARLTAEDRTEIREIAAAARRAPGRILELAAGAGRLTVPLLALGREVTAVDSSAAMLEQLRERVPARFSARLTAVHADMADVVAEAAFGLVVLGATSITLLEPDRRAVLYEAVAANSTDGALFAVTVAQEGVPRPGPLPRDPSRPVLSHEDRGARRVVNVLVPPGADGVATLFTSSVTRLDRSTLVAELVAHGFEPVKETPVRGPDGLPTGVVLVEALCPRR